MPGFQSPAEFEATPHVAPRGARDPSSRLWLIRAPAEFEPRSFSGKKIPLVGFQTLRSKTCEEKVYNVFAALGKSDGVSLILPLEAEGRTESYSDFAGCITIDENWEGASSSAKPHSIPASPAPSLPPNLKLRFQPFGVGPPGWSLRKRGPERGVRKKRGRKEPADRGLEPGCSAAEPETPGDALKKKKKKKKNKERQEFTCQSSDPEKVFGKRSKEETDEAVPPESDSGHKKKRKKDRV